MSFLNVYPPSASTIAYYDEAHMSFVTMVAINIQFVSMILITTILLFEMPSMLLWLVNIPPIKTNYVAPWAS
jgi:hypothetical protein